MMKVENPCNDCVRKGTMSCDQQLCLRYNLFKNGPKFGFQQTNAGENTQK